MMIQDSPAGLRILVVEDEMLIAIRISVAMSWAR
jgi:hypothetical protein